jgi:hypothetical protein
MAGRLLDQVREVIELRHLYLPQQLTEQAGLPYHHPDALVIPYQPVSIGRHMINIRHEFAIEAFVDFPDDAITAMEPITPAHIDAMIRRLAESGVRRVSWEVYGDGHGGLLIPAHDARWENMARTYTGLGHNSLAVAVEAAHRHGLEIYAYFKPYETGCAALFPEGSYEATAYGRTSQIGGRMTWIEPFVVDHPHLRIRRCMDDLPANIQAVPICGLRLRKRDASPTRVTREHLQLWASDQNYRYRRLDIPLEVHETVEPSPQDVHDLFSEKLLARKGDPQRVLHLSGFELRDRYVLVTTDFADGPADFENTDLAMISAWDAAGRQITGVIASGAVIWFGEQVDFRNWGLMYDLGYNGQVMRLDDPNADGRRGIVAFARGRNEYLPGAMCEAEPQVQDFWLRCIDGVLDTGVDGVDLREENHSTHTNHPTEYGYNEAVLAQCRQRGRVDCPTIAAVRGDAYTAFLARAKGLINSRGAAMRIHFQIDWYRPSPPLARRLAYPANMDFQWQRWIEQGLTDEAVLRFFALPFDCVFDDPVAQEMVARCRAKGIPVTVNRYIRPDTLAEEFLRVRRDGRFAGFILYETCSFLKILPDGGCENSVPVIPTLQGLQ